MLEPCGHRVLIKIGSVKKTTGWGFEFITNERDEKLEKLGTARGTIVKIGPTAWKMESLGNKNWAEVGDEVYFAKYGGTLLIDPDDGEEYVILNDQDISCLIKRTKVDTDE